MLVSLPAVRKVITAGKPKKQDSTYKFWKRFFSHNLLELAQEANFPLTEAEQRTALALSQYIYWRGRYVVPTERGMDDFIPITFENGLADQIHQIAPIDATNLMERVVAEARVRLYA